MWNKMKLYGSIEAGGTKFVCAVGNDKLEIIDIIQFPTTKPKETLEMTVNYFERFKDNLQSVSVASFGPIDMVRGSKTYGYITSTPKLFWDNTNIIGFLKDRIPVIYYFTTDVNASAFGEMVVRKDVDSLVYYTIGTGIGGGVIQSGHEIGGVGHGELGHIYVAKHPADYDFDGVCPFHGACLEGLAAGPSLEARTGIKGELIPENHPVWVIQAFYIAQAVMQATLSFRPQIIVLGGGVMKQSHMLKRVKSEFIKLLNGYVSIPPIDDYIVLPAVDNNGSATVGNFWLAKRKLTTD